MQVRPAAQNTGRMSMYGVWCVASFCYWPWKCGMSCVGGAVCSFGGMLACNVPSRTSARAQVPGESERSEIIKMVF